jgi:hypothetical protein
MTFPLDSVRDALRQLRNRQVSGRIVLLPTETPNVAAQPAA